MKRFAGGFTQIVFLSDQVMNDPRKLRILPEQSSSGNAQKDPGRQNLLSVSRFPPSVQSFAYCLGTFSLPAARFSSMSAK